MSEAPAFRSSGVAGTCTGRSQRGPSVSHWPRLIATSWQVFSQTRMPRILSLKPIHLSPVYDLHRDNFPTVARHPLLSPRSLSTAPVSFSWMIPGDWTQSLRHAVQRSHQNSRPWPRTMVGTYWIWQTLNDGSGYPRCFDGRYRRSSRWSSRLLIIWLLQLPPTGCVCR